MNPKRYLSLDIGEKRTGLAIGDDVMKIPVPHSTIQTDNQIIEKLNQLVKDERVDALVVGYPRNQQGDVTAQTEYVEKIAEELRKNGHDVIFQDESLTSIVAEQRLKARGKAYQKADIDAEAAAVILQDYLETV